MDTSTQNDPSYTEKMEVVNGLIGILAGEIGKKYGATLGVAAASILTGKSGTVIGMIDLIDKIQNGTATTDDYVDVIEPIANVAAGIGVAVGVLNPAFLGAMSAVGLLRITLDAINPNSPLRGMIKEIDLSKLNINLQEGYDYLTPEEKQSLYDFSLTYNDPNNPNTTDPDTDRDGIPDRMDPDMDGDGVPNDQDSDTDGDGLPDGVDPNPLTPDSGRSNGFPPGYDPASGKGYSPLVLDLDGNGTHTTAITVSRTYYDLDNDGMAELVGWSDGMDGFLAYDRDGDGVIENGTQLLQASTFVMGGKTKEITSAAT